uniref:TRASH domain-containing protein n=1 Tax=Electrophorus electricus TaxID=8005 RepID=A0A4W4F2L1_ELEEL
MCKEGDGEEEKDGALGLVFPLEAERGSEEEKSEQEQNIPKKVDGEQPENQTENVKHETEKDTSEQHEKMEKEEDNEVENMEMEEKSEEDESPAEGIEQEEQEEKKHACLEATVISTMEDLQSESSAETPMDIDQTEEKMQVDDVQHSESWLNIGELLRVQPVAEAEKKTAIPISGSPPVKIKDEPMDEEYEKALAPHAPAGRVKDEPDMNEVSEFTQKSSDEIKISAVFSVGGNSTPIGSSTGSTTGSVGLAHSAKASPNSSSAVPSCTPASPLCVVCSGCKKVLLKGQTAFQRKGCPQLYCSTHCLCSSTATQLVVKPKKICHYCLKEISNPKDVIIAPVDSAGAVKDFCSQKCLSAFNYKRDGANSVLATDQKSTKCSMCPKTCTMRHEVNFMGGVHKLCSDTCFNQFRAFNKLTMNCCVHCGGYCYSGDGQCPTMLIESAVKKFCSQNCVMFFKKKYTKLVPCTMCRAYRSMVEMVENTNKEGSRELFCSSACVTAHKVQTVSSSGTALECNNCKQIQVPQYHLAMSDGTIRNFCCFSCVVSFQDSFNKSNSQNQLNVAPSLSGASPAPKLVPTKPISVDSKASGVLRIPAVTKIPCAQCQRSFFRKPELLDFKGKMYAFCDKACIDEFRRTNYIMAQCVYCKIDKVVKEVKRINNVDCSFCSEGCKLLYKHDLAKRWGKQHCRSCLYCSGTSQTVVTSVFGGKKEEFCGNECLSQYTLLFCEVAKCSMCKRTRQMLESVKWLGEIKHFCNLQCLMYFCSVQGNAAAPVNLTPKTPLTQGKTKESLIGSWPGGKDATPVIANVISLSSATNGQPPVMGCAASTQTDAVKPPSAPPPRILKNKALLCKPLNQNKGTSCKPNSSDITTQTDEAQPKVIVLPLPVPVFVPVPMQLYTQYTPVGMGLPLPVPVPMFLPTTLDSAEQIVETIQKIKEKIPDNPLEADLIMMAEMVAEDSEKEQAVSRGGEHKGGGRDLEKDDRCLCGSVAMQLVVKPALTKSCHWSDDFPQNIASIGYMAGLPNISKLHKEYGIQTWKSWIRWRNSQPNLEMPKLGSRSMTLKEDLLQCSTAELSYGLCKFISEARRPNGETYSPDSIYYLCLGIQQHLFENSRMENIFADLFYAKFSQSITSILKDWKPTILPSGYVHSRVEEEYLWECKQLGAFSPSVLLNTLLFFCTKHFCFRTLAQHRRLSFAHVMRCTRTHNGAKVACLRFYPPVPKEGKSARECFEDDVVLEMQENAENPLRCPVRLYEFYLSKCSATVKQRINVFYLRPERSCVPNSPLWFSSMALDDEGLDSMLTRILTVRELHLETEKSSVAFDSDNPSNSD